MSGQDESKSKDDSRPMGTVVPAGASSTAPMAPSMRRSSGYVPLGMFLQRWVVKTRVIISPFSHFASWGWISGLRVKVAEEYIQVMSAVMIVDGLKDAKLVSKNGSRCKRNAVQDLRY